MTETDELVDPVHLFEEYLAVRAEGGSPDVQDFLLRARGRAAELRELLDTLTELEDIPQDPDDPANLLAEYLLISDRGEKPDLEAFIARAGDRADEFRELIRTMTGFDDLSVLLAEPKPVPVDLESLGRFQDLKLVGKGGLSCVFRAFDPKLAREVALKVIEPAALGIEDAQGSVMSEARSLARLEHESIVQVYDVDEAEGYGYIAMEFVPGPSLFDTLEAMRAIARGSQEPRPDFASKEARALDSIAARCRFVVKLARALDFCHDQGVIHRDVKPGNILIDEHLVPKLIDFGLAHSEADDSSFGITQRLIGTAPYAAPEQVEQDRTGASPASDQFSLGTVLYELLTLENPFHKETRSQTLDAIAQAAPAPPRELNPAIPYDVERICLHCLERLPSDRYSTITGLVEDLEAFLEYRAISVQPPSPIKQLSLWFSRHKREIVPAALSVGAVLVLASGLWFRAEVGKRTRIIERVEEQLASLGEIDGPEELAERFQDIRDNRGESDELDDSLLAGFLFEETGTHLDRLGESSSKRLADVITPQFAEHEDELEFRHRFEGFSDLFATWQSVLFAERLSCEGLVHNERFHRRGSVQVPEDGVLWTYGTASSPQIPQLVRHEDPEKLERGLYRLVQESPDGELREVEFFYSQWEPRRTIAAAPLALSIRQRMIHIEGSRLELMWSSTPTEQFVPSFEMMPDLVTWAEARELVPDEVAAALSLFEDYPEGIRPSTEEDAPACLPYVEALKYAARAGGRLPTSVELWAANRQVPLVPEEPESELATEGLESDPVPGEIEREWVSAFHVEAYEQHYAFKHDQLEVAEVDLWLREPSARQVTKTGFRLVLSARD